MEKRILFLYFILALGIKLALFFILNQSKIFQFSGFIGELSGDSNGYLNPVDQLFETGVFYSAHRMPGYSLVYFFFSLFFNKVLSLNLLVIFQVAMSALSCVILAHLSYLISHKMWVFISTFILTLFSTYLTWYDGYVLTESLTASVLILLVYFVGIYFLVKRNWRWMLVAGLLYSWLVFLRPVFFPLSFLFFLLFFINKLNWRAFGFNVAIFISPFLFFDSLWILANCHWHKKFVPLQVSFLGPSQSNVFFEPAFRFIQTWGGNYQWWDPGAEIRYFGVGHDSLVYSDQDKIVFPKEIFTSEFTIDSLEVLRQELLALKLDSGFIIESEFDLRSKSIYRKFEDYSMSIKRENPKLYWFDSRLSLIHQFFFTTKIRNPFYNVDFPLRDQFIYIKSLAYIGTLVFGYISSVILLFFLKREPVLMLLTGIVWYVFLIHPIVLRVVENRYLLPSYPFLVLSIILGFYFVTNKYVFRKKQVDTSGAPA
ncbi:hypothetical protein J0A68_18470 [Algoriphagus sp. H41]|uniref:Glycosyltransferase RgtA/B/C/D-like domain-containing protein n=1 Tax=Algoriphagus oliviformis TaxID=2811231 RepID=A0ABS3C751_9BACT|nr:hypothetical protein [Algoriphagus oliviformis]MBN7812948.1 hypothetical protein [Algoriphagus oliviformis]